MRVNCRGGEFARDVEWDRVEVIVEVEDVCRLPKPKPRRRGKYKPDIPSREMIDRF
jgi:hypothetical protein